MLETLVPSKIRRTLLEHLLIHPDQRFYLRGLAKALALPISPLRRELLRLEQLGLLRAYNEANVRFYVVDQAHPLFTQLKQAAALPAGRQGMPASGAASPDPVGVSTVLSAHKIERIRRALRPPIPWPMVAGAVGLGGLILYLVVANQRLLFITHQAVSLPVPPVVTVLTHPRPSAQVGEMRSTRWHLLPGVVGGFSQVTGGESD